MCEEQSAGQKQEKPNFALSQPRVIPEPGHPLPSLEKPHGTRREWLHPFCCSQNDSGYQYFPFNSAVKPDLPKSIRAQQLWLGLPHPPPIKEGGVRLMACCR